MNTASQIYTSSAYCEAVRLLLDRSIADVADGEYRRLKRLSGSRYHHDVREALRQLGGLKGGDPPKYDDPWVALFYLTWYQPRQINLAASLARQYLPHCERPRNIIDVGCGSFATLFGVAIAIADSQYSTSSPDPIGYYGIDSANHMRRIGIRLLYRFRDLVEEASRSDLVYANKLDVLFSVLDSFFPFVTGSNKQHDGEDVFWLSALHAVYKSNSGELARKMQDLRTAHPRMAFEMITAAHDIQLVKAISRNEARQVSLAGNFVFRGWCPQITGWRYKVACDFVSHSGELSSKDRYLCRNVPWTRSHVGTAWLAPSRPDHGHIS